MKTDLLEIVTDLYKRSYDINLIRRELEKVEDKHSITSCLTLFTICNHEDEDKLLDLFFDIINSSFGYNQIDIYAFDNILLSFACAHGKLPLVKYLLERNCRTESGSGSFLSRACENGHVDVVRCLLEKGAKLDRKYINLSSINNIEIIDLFLDYLDPCEIIRNMPNTIRGWNSITHIVKKLNGKIKAIPLIDDEDLFEHLVSNGLDVNFEDFLFETISKDKQDLVELLLEKGAFCDDPKYLEKAKEVGNKEIIKYFDIVSPEEVLDEINKISQQVISYVIPCEMNQYRFSIPINIIKTLSEKKVFRRIELGKLLEENKY